MADLIRLTESGLFCEAGDFYIDPWAGVERAIITHGHSDHARYGSQYYLAAIGSEGILRKRLGADIHLETEEYGKARMMNGVRVSLYPAGHILGSAQVRVEYKGEVWVVSGDYKTTATGTAVPFEPVRCDTFITESTFGLPIFRWPHEQEIFSQINSWWQENRQKKRCSLLLAYSLGKAQRLLAGIDSSIGPLYAHGSVMALNEAYSNAGIYLPAVKSVVEASDKLDSAGAFVIAPPSVEGSPFVKRLGNYSTGFASGWMAIRGNRRRRAYDRGFVLSDHADWPSLLNTIRATGASRIIVTHGYSEVLSRYLLGQGLQSEVLRTRFEGENISNQEE